MELEKRQYGALAAIAAILIVWVSVPLIAQYYYGYSAVKVSFGVTTLYFIGFQIWKRFLKEED